MLVCFTFIFFHIDISSLYLGVDLSSDSVSVCIHMHTELFLNPGSCSAVTGYFFVMSAFLSLYRGIFYVGLLDHVRCNEDFVLLMFVL